VDAWGETMNFCGKAVNKKAHCDATLQCGKLLTGLPQNFIAASAASN
jgi:hypothetical protein